MAAHQLPPKPMFTHWQEDHSSTPRNQQQQPPYSRRYREDERDRERDMPPAEGSSSSYPGPARGQDTYIPRDSRDAYNPPPHHHPPPPREWEAWERARDRERSERDFRGGSGSAPYVERQGWDERDVERYRREREPRYEHERERVVRDWERDRNGGRYERDSYRKPYPPRRPGAHNCSSFCYGNVTYVFLQNQNTSVDITQHHRIDVLSHLHVLSVLVLVGPHLPIHQQ